MTEKLSEFLAEHRASEFGLAPVSKAMAVKMAIALEQRVEQLETEGCGQCEACEDFFPLSLLSITDDGVALCPGDWDEVLAATADLAAEEEA